MLEGYLNRYKYTQAFLAKLYWKFFYQSKDIQKVVEEHEVPSTYTVKMWIRGFQKQLENDMVVLPAMTEEQKASL